MQRKSTFFKTKFVIICYNSSDLLCSNVSTLQCILTVVGASALGFKQDIVYGVGRHASEKLVNIMSVNSILVHCNIIHSSYMRASSTCL